MSKAFKHRPPACVGCPLHPDSNPDPARCGAYVPPTCACPGCNGWAEAFNWHSGRARKLCKAPLMALGIAPGEEEARRNEPLVGPSGRLLEAALRWAKYGNSPMAKLNLVNCRTTTQGATRLVNRDPTKTEIAACMERITGPIIEHYPGTILLLGGLAFSTVMRETFGTFAESRGYRLELDDDYWETGTRMRLSPTPKRRKPSRKFRQCACGRPLEPRRRKCNQCRTAK